MAMGRGRNDGGSTHGEAVEWSTSKPSSEGEQLRLVAKRACGTVDKTRRVVVKARHDVARSSGVIGGGKQQSREASVATAIGVIITVGETNGGAVATSAKPRQP